MPQAPPISFQVRTKNVLIIDGNEAMQKLRAKVLRSRGVHVHTAKSVTEAELLWVPDFFDFPDGGASKGLPVPRPFRRSAPNVELDGALAPACWTSDIRTDANQRPA